MARSQHPESSRILASLHHRDQCLYFGPWESAGWGYGPVYSDFKGQLYIYTVYIYICLYFSRAKLPFKCRFPVYIKHPSLSIFNRPKETTCGPWQLGMVNPGKKTEFCCKCQLALMFYLSIHLLSCPVLSYPTLSYPSKIYTIYNYIYIFILCTTFIHLNVHWMFIPYSWARGFNPSICSHLSRSSSTPTSIGPPNDVNWLFEGVLLQQNVTWKLANRPFLWETMDFKYLNVMLVYWRPAS